MTQQPMQPRAMKPSPVDLTNFERALLARIIADEAPAFRLHLDKLSVVQRSRTAAGIYVRFADRTEPRHETRAPVEIALNLHADMAGWEHGVGVILYLDDGRIDCLEVFSYDAARRHDVPLTIPSGHRTAQASIELWAA
jgi:hypothetical protein